MTEVFERADQERLSELWSPEQICGRLKERGLPSVSHEAIYQRIYADKRNGVMPCVAESMVAAPVVMRGGLPRSTT